MWGECAATSWRLEQENVASLIPIIDSLGWYPLLSDTPLTLLYGPGIVSYSCQETGVQHCSENGQIAVRCSQRLYSLSQYPNPHTIPGGMAAALLKSIFVCVNAVNAAKQGLYFIVLVNQGRLYDCDQKT